MIFKFRPLLKQTLWGGNRIIPFKNINADVKNIGETWDISGLKDAETKVSNGPFRGRSINTLLSGMKEKLIGEANYRRFGNTFPLLIKFIDARQDLSIQVHPDDDMAIRHGNECGKNEMWYVMESTPGATIYAGLKHPITPEEYKERVANDTITEVIASYPAREGDIYFIPAGRIHSIGAGCFVAEIQQTCDITYRIYDYKRRDKDGNYRTLHTEKAAEAIDYTVYDEYRAPYESRKNEGVNVVSCPYFDTAIYDLDEPMTLDYSELDSFVILIVVAGEGELTDNEGNTTTLHCGETVLLSATTEWVTIEGNIKFLETYIVSD